MNRNILETMKKWNRTYLMFQADPIAVPDPKFLSPINPKDLVNELLSKISDADAKAFGSSIAVGGAPTIATVLGEAWAVTIKFKDSITAGNFRPFTVTLDCTDTDGALHTRAISMSPEPGGGTTSGFHYLLLKRVNGNLQPSRCTAAGGVTATVAADAIRAGSSLEVINHTKSDLLRLEMEYKA